MAKNSRRRTPLDGDATKAAGAHPLSSTTTLSSFPSPSSSSSSSDFEFAVSLSPTSKKLSSQLCPADDLFYKGQLLPLHLSPRLSMVRTLILASSSGSSSSDTTTASRDSSGSSNDSTASFSSDQLLLLAAAAAAECDSSRPSSVTEDDARKVHRHQHLHNLRHSRYFSTLATKFSSVFSRNKKENQHQDEDYYGNSSSGFVEAQIPPSSSALSSCYFVPLKRSASPSTSTSSTAKEVIKKYVRKVKPLYEKLSARQQYSSTNLDGHDGRQQRKTFSFSVRRGRARSSPRPAEEMRRMERRQSSREIYPHSFSGNLRYPRKKRYSMAASCPSSMRSSPSHSGLLGSAGGCHVVRAVPPPPAVAAGHHHSGSTTSMEELQSAIQGAIAHCKKSMAQPTTKN